MIGWFKRLLGLDGSIDSDDEDTESEKIEESDFSQYTLYEIGDRLCRHHEDGIGYTKEATHFGEYSMGVVLQDAYDRVTLEPDMIRDLDRLTEHAEDTKMQAKASGGIDPDKVETFREEFFDCFPQDEIERVLGELYHEIHDDTFALDELVEEHTTDGFEFRYQITDPQPAQIAMEDEPMAVQATNFHEESVKMRKVAAQVHLAKSNITDTIEEMVVEEAKLFWQQVDVSDDSDFDPEDFDAVIESMLDAMMAIKEELGDPDTIVTNDDFEWHEQVHGCDVLSDESGVMDVSFVVADSGHLGYRVTATPVSSFKPNRIEAPNVYRVQWNGNYAITDPDMIAGPA